MTSSPAASSAASGSRRPLSASFGSSPRLATSWSRSNAGRLPASRSSGSLNAGNRPSTSSSWSARSRMSPSRMPSTGTERRGVTSMAALRRALPALLFHALDAQALAPSAREEVDPRREADPGDAQADEQRSDSDQGFRARPPSELDHMAARRRRSESRPRTDGHGLERGSRRHEAHTAGERADLPCVVAHGTYRPGGQLRRGPAATGVVARA